MISSADLGQPVTVIAEAVYSRCISALKDQRTQASSILKGPVPVRPNDGKAFVENTRRALYAAKIISYTQGYMLMRAAALEYGWNLSQRPPAKPEA